MSIITKTFKTIGKLNAAADILSYGTYVVNAKFVEQRSVTSKMLEDFLLKNYPKYKFFPGQIKANQKEYQKNLKKGDKPYRINEKIAQTLNITQHNNLLYFNNEGSQTMLYLYGNSFWNEISIFQLHFISTLAKTLDMRIIVPIQGIAPFKEYYNVYYDILSVLAYQELNIDYLGADGSGAIYIYNLLNDGALEDSHMLKNIKKILLFSPMCNLELDDSIINKEDPIIDPYSISRQIRYFFKNNTEEIKKHNPFNFRMENLPDTLIIAATKDSLYKDQAAFYHRFKHTNNPVKLWTFNHMIHCFNFYPLVETQELLRDIKNYVLLDKDREKEDE